MTIDKLKRLILKCLTYSNQDNIFYALNAVDELVATLQLTQIDNLCLYKEAIVKGEVCAVYNNNYTENGKEFKATVVELLIKHEE